MDNDTIMGNAVREVINANTAVRKLYKYDCGITEIGLDNLKDDKAKFFFQSPDGQDYVFYMKLCDAGFKEDFFSAPYHWGVQKNGVAVCYIEGDVYLSLIK